MDIEKIDIGYKSPVIIVDGFYDNPDEVRKYGLSLDYFPFSQSAQGWHSSVERAYNGESLFFNKGKVYKTQREKNIFNMLIGPNENIASDWHTTAVAGGHNGVFHIRGESAHLSDVHNDISSIPDTENIHGWSVVLYLSPDAPKESGTSIWRCVDTDKCWDMKSVYLEKEKNCREYKREITIDNVYNRCILFRSEVFHAAEPGFGNTGDINNIRLTQTFYFNLK